MPWIESYRNGIDIIDDLDGVSWHGAPLPRRLHRCRAQTRGFMLLTRIERCACGASRHGNGRWFDRNQTRKSRRRNKKRSPK